MDPQLLALLAQSGQGLGESIGSGDWGSALSSLGGTLPGGILSGISSRRKKKRLQRQIAKQRRIAGRIQETGLKQQEGLARLATEKRVGGLENAERAASVAGRRSIQAAQEQGAALQGRANQSLASRGLGSTTIADNAARAIGTDVSRNIAGINEGLGQQLGALATQKGAVQAGGIQDLADLAANRTEIGVNSAQFWMPKYLQQLGFGEGFSQGGAGQTGIDPQLLQWIFGGQGG